MADRYAIKSGLWSDVTTWDGATTKPTTGDIVRPNGFTVTIDENADFAELRNDAGGGASAGGEFQVSGAYTLTGNLICCHNTVVLLRATPANGVTVTIDGDALMGKPASGSAGSWVISHEGVGQVTITGSVKPDPNMVGSAAASSQGVAIQGGGTLYVVGDIRGGANSYGYGVTAYSTLTPPGAPAAVANAALICDGAIVGGANGTSHAVYINVSGDDQIRGSVENAAGRGYYNLGGGSITLTGHAKPGTYSPINATSKLFLLGDGAIVEQSSTSWPLEVRQQAILDGAKVQYILPTHNGTGFVDEESLYTPNNPLGFDAPDAADVRDGTVYNNGGTTGTLAVPDPSLVAQGVPTDATVGTLEAARLPKNTALLNFPFAMRDSQGAGVTGLTVTAERSLDGGAFAACANAVAEIGNGYYKINLDAADLNGDTVILRFTASGAVELAMLVITG